MNEFQKQNGIAKLSLVDLIYIFSFVFYGIKKLSSIGYIQDIKYRHIGVSKNKGVRIHLFVDVDVKDVDVDVKDLSLGEILDRFVNNTNFISKETENQDIVRLVKEMLKKMNPPDPVDIDTLLKYIWDIIEKGGGSKASYTKFGFKFNYDLKKEFNIKPKTPKILVNNIKTCVFRPPFNCKDGTVFDDKYVGKICYDEKQGKAEWEKSNLIRGIIGYEFFIYPKAYCKVDAYNFINTKINNLQKSDLFQLVSPYGDELDVFIKNAVKWSRIDLLTLLSSLFYGIKKLLEADYIHQNLKSSNILISQEKDVRIVIDFDYIVNSKDFYSNNKRRDENAFYYVNPPEYRLYSNALLMDGGGGKRKFEQEELEQKELELIGLHIKQDFTITDSTFKTELHTYVKEFFTKSTEERTELFKKKTFHTKSDIYSLGLLIKGYVENNTIPDDDKDIVMLVNDLIYKMIHPDPSKRADIDTLIKDVKKITGGTEPKPKPELEPESKELDKGVVINAAFAAAAEFKKIGYVSTTLKPEFKLVQKKYPRSSVLLASTDTFFSEFFLEKYKGGKSTQESLINTIQSLTLDDLIAIKKDTQVNPDEIEIKALSEKYANDVIEFAHKSRNFASLPHIFIQLAVFLNKRKDRNRTEPFIIYEEYTDKKHTIPKKTKVTDNDINIYEQLCKIVDIYIVSGVKPKQKQEEEPKTLSSFKEPTEHILDEKVITDVLKEATKKDPLFEKKSPELSSTEYAVSLFMYIVIFLLIWDSQRLKTLELVASDIGYTTYPIDQNVPIEPPFELTSVCSSVFYTCIQTMIFMFVIKLCFQCIKLVSKGLRPEEIDQNNNKISPMFIDQWEKAKKNHYNLKEPEPLPHIPYIPQQTDKEAERIFLKNEKEKKRNYDDSKKRYDKYIKLKNLCKDKESVYQRAIKYLDTDVNDCFSFPFHLVTEFLTMFLSLLCVEVILYIYAKLIVPRDINLLRMTTVQMHVNIMYFLFLVIYLVIYMYLTYKFRVYLQ